MHKKLSLISVSSLLLLQSLTTMANDKKDFARVILDAESKYPVNSLSESDLEELKRIFNVNKLGFVRPEQCPMDSRNYKDILGKIESIKNMFRDTSCMSDPTQLDDILSKAQTIQTELNNAGVDTSKVQSQVPTEINGQNISSVFNNINNLFFKSRCDLSDRSVLEKGADLVQNFSQMGLLVPNANGLVISAGGMALSSILRMIHSLFEKKFEFENNGDRQNFIKLNCAFYDIRREIENSGLTDISTTEHQNDQVELNKLLKSIESKIKENTENKNKLLKVVSDSEAEYIKIAQGALTKLETNVKKSLEVVKVSVVDTDNKPAETIKKDIITKMALLRSELVESLSEYINSNMSQIPVLDQDLISELKKLDSFNNANGFLALYKMDAKDFNNTYRASLLFHFERVQRDIESLKSQFSKKFVKETIINGLDINAYKKSIEEKAKKIEEELNKSFKQGKVVDQRLARIVGTGQSYTRNDDGTENKTAILNSFDEISNQVYGKWGYEFLKYTTGEAKKENSSFKSKFKDFADKHLRESENRYVIPKVEEIGDLRAMFACQDVRPYLRSWVLSDSLSQQGYDFIATNKELFHSDIPRVFLGKTGNRNGVHKIKSKFEVIQDHHKSSIFAKAKLKGEDISRENEDRYLGSKAKRKKLLGTVMLDIEGTRTKASFLQQLDRQYECSKRITEDR